MTGRRLQSAPLITSLSQSTSAEATSLGVLGTSTEATLSDLPSPASSAIEALELESVTFGQDAADLLDEHSSDVGRG